MITEEEEEKIYSKISESLLLLCEEKPSNPIDFLGRKMAELIGDDPNNLARTKKEEDPFIKATKKESTNLKDVIISKEQLALTNEELPFEKKYKIGMKLYGNSIYLIEDLQKNEKNKIIRIINKKGICPTFGERKIKLLHELDYPDVIKIHEIYDEEKCIKIVEDYCSGSDFGSFLYLHKDKITVNLIKSVVRQVLNGISYLHKNNILHKNINLKTILVYNPSFNPDEILIKIGGLAYCEAFNKGEIIRNDAPLKLDNPIFLAPELLNKAYTEAVDIWAIGILAYILFLGKTPFKEDEELIGIAHKIATAEIEYPEDIDPDLKEFLQGCLDRNVNTRYNVDQLLKLKFLKERREDVKARITTETINVLGCFKIGDYLRRSVLSYIMSKKLYDEEDVNIINTYKALDLNKDGKVSIRELCIQMSNLFKGKSRETRREKARLLMNIVDINLNGTLEYSEFLTIMTLVKSEKNIKILKEVFDFFDHDKSGIITPMDLREIFEQTNITDEEFHGMIDAYDQDASRGINFEEFLELVMWKDSIPDID